MRSAEEPRLELPPGRYKEWDPNWRLINEMLWRSGVYSRSKREPLLGTVQHWSKRQAPLTYIPQGPRAHHAPHQQAH
eukprot:scaffold19241_cov105-Isochrysis_galbana.AAC.3